MYHKEIIYMGLYKEESRIGSAGFLKVENREREGKLHLKIQNIPLGISGRFPIRVYDGDGWKEIDGIAVQEGRGSWEENLAKPADRVILKVMLPSGYYLEGRSRSALDENLRGKSEPTVEESVAREANPVSETNVTREANPVSETSVAREANPVSETSMTRGARGGPKGCKTCKRRERGKRSKSCQRAGNGKGDQPYKGNGFCESTG